MPQQRNFDTATGPDDIIHPSTSYALVQNTFPYKRSRRWERKQLNRKVVYRGVDPKLSLRVKSIADNLHIPTGEVASTVIEFGLRAYEQGDLDLHPYIRPNIARKTLHPISQNHRKPDMKRKSNNSPQTSWRVITTWRNFSPELKRTISALASEEGLNVPIGELVSALLRYGLNAHEAGLLKLEPDEKAIAQSLLEKTKP